MCHRRLVAAALLGFSVLLRPVNAAELSIVGTGDGIDMLRALSSSFREIDASLKVDIPPSIGSGGGITAVGSGKSTLARVARRLTEAEVSRGLAYTPLAKMPSAFFVHPSVRISHLTSDQLAAIYDGRISNWQEVGGSDQRIRVVRREEADSTLVILRATLPGWRDLQVTERSKTAVSTQEAIETVRLVEGAIGFGPYSPALDTGTKVLAIDGRHPTHPEYPCNGELALVHMEGELTPEAERFIAFSKTTTAHDVIRKFGGIPVDR